MNHVLMVALGGALGALARYGTSLLAAALWGRALPLGTWAVNMIGCFLIGVLTPLLLRTGTPEAWRYLLIVGFMGSFTTFSTFSLETVVYWQESRYALALLNTGGSVVVGVAFVLLGMKAGDLLWPVS